MNVSDFKDWVRTAPKGRRVVYTATRGTPDEAFYRSEIMEAARRSYKDGRVTLVQRRTKPADSNCFDYIAERL